MSTVKDLVRDKILDAMTDLLRKNNVRSITINDVAEKAGVSRMTVYRHFKDKYEIETAIYDRDSRVGLDQYEKDHDFLKYMAAGIRVIMEKKEVYRNMFEDLAHQNSFLEGWVETTRSSLIRMAGKDFSEELNIEMYYLLYGGFYVSWAFVQGKIDMDVDSTVETILKCWPDEIKDALRVPR